MYLRRRMDKDAEIAARNHSGMRSYFDDGYIEQVDDDAKSSHGMTWCKPHHVFFNPKKPKLSFVLDYCHVRQSVINQAVHQGLEFTNKLEFCLDLEKPVAITADIQAMYHEVRVTPAHRDVLRFL